MKISGALNARGSPSHFLLHTSIPLHLIVTPFRSPQPSSRIGFAAISMRSFNSDRQARLDLSAFILKYETQPRDLERTRIVDCSHAGKYCWIEREYAQQGFLVIKNHFIKKK